MGTHLAALKGFPGRLRGQKGCRESHPRRPHEGNAIPAPLAPGPHLGYFQAGRDESISTEVQSKARMSSSPILLQKSPSNPIPTAIRTIRAAIRPEKGIKGILVGTEEVKVSLFAEDTTIYLPRST